MNIAETQAGAVLSTLTEETPVNSIERADRKAVARRSRPKARNVIKPAAKPAPKAKVVKAPSQTVAEIVAACTALKIETKNFGSGSFVLRLPAWAEFKTRLPKTGAVAEVKLFHTLRDAIKDLTGDAAATWVMHKTGSFAVYSKFAK
jgi:hypothetical protein